MKKLLLFTVIITAFGWAANAQKKSIKVPAKVASAFKEKFPGASALSWEMENAKEYEVNFKENGKPVSANFDAAGTWMETEAGIDIASLPGAVSATATKKAGNKITAAYRIEKSDGSTTFEVEIRNGKKKSEMILNPDGTPLKK
ncbi:MAG: PepSY-like domain-containing protein [Chitinophagaceae bacterium]